MSGLAGLLAWLWATAQTAAFLGGHGQLATGLSGAIAAGFQLPHHLNEPAMAWPTAVQRQLPGPVGYWATSVATGAALVALAAWVWVRLAPRPGPERRE